MRKIHIVAAVGCSSLLLSLLALAGPAGASSRRVDGAGTAATAKALPHTTIRGKPAHFKPKTLSAHARWNGISTCTSSNASFTVTNKEASSQTIVFTGVTHGVVVVPGHTKFFICIGSGTTGKGVGTLSDGKKLTVHLS